LDGSAGSLGLHGLFASALTAFTFFRWLTETYHSPETPVASCRLLLSPTAEELSIAAELAPVPTADFATCQSSIRAWYAEMNALPSRTLERSKAIFFFSGHGSQITKRSQLLLPSDYLDGTPDYDLALSTKNLSDGLGPLGLRGEYFFIDACRSRLPWPGSVKGAQILDADVEVRAFNNDYERVLLYATKAGRETWQPNDPSDDISIFGRALLEGLTQASVDDECDPGFLSADTLHPFVAERASDLMQERTGRAVPRSVVKDGPFYTGCFCARRPFQTSWWVAESRDSRPPDTMPEYAEIIARGSATRVRLDEATDFGTAYPMLQSETLTEMWRGKQVHGLEEVDASGVITVEASSVATVRQAGMVVEGGNAFAMEFVAEGQSALALELSADRHWFALLPRQEVFLRAYQVHFSREDDTLSRFELGLADEQSDGDLERLLPIVRGTSREFRRALEDLEDGALSAAGPVKAVLVAVVLARHRLFEGQPWLDLGDLADAASTATPDVLVLLAERERRGGRVGPFYGTVEAALSRGVPRMADPFEMLLEQLDFVDRRKNAGDPQAVALSDLPDVQAIRELELFYKPGGLFTAFEVPSGQASAVRDILLSKRS